MTGYNKEFVLWRDVGTGGLASGTCSSLLGIQDQIDIFNQMFVLINTLFISDIGTVHGKE